MADSHSLFQDFSRAIALGSNRKKELRRSRDAVRKKIRKYFKEKHSEFSPKFHGQGSFMMNTIIEPLDKEFDIDDGIYFQVEAEPNQKVSTFHRWVCEAVDGHTNQDSIDKQTCVRVIYANSYHIDLPIYYIVEGQAPRLAHKGEDWIESDPREFLRWFNNQIDEAGQLKRIVRYLKAWSDYRKGDLPSGLIFSILAVDNISFDERDDVAFYETLANIKNSLDSEFSCYRPTVPEDEDLLENYSKTNKDYLLDMLDSFIQDADKAVSDAADLEDASKLWRRHFGKNRFPLHINQSDSSSSLHEFYTEPNLRDDSDIFPKYRNTEDFIENYHSVYIQYDLTIRCKVSQDGFMPRLLDEMLRRKFPLLRNRDLEFYIHNHSVPKPFSVKWKICNVGSEAIRRNQTRGQILDDDGRCRRIEHSDFRGAHFVECYIIKNNVCVARAKADVPITSI